MRSRRSRRSIDFNRRVVGSLEFSHHYKRWAKFLGSSAGRPSFVRPSFVSALLVFIRAWKIHRLRRHNGLCLAQLREFRAKQGLLTFVRSQN